MCFVCFRIYSVIPATSMNCSVVGFNMAVAFKGMEKVSVILISFVELMPMLTSLKSPVVECHPSPAPAKMLNFSNA